MIFMNQSNIEKKIFEMILNVYRLIKKNFYLYKEINLTMIQLHALFFIKENKNCHLKDLAKYFSITLPTANSLVERLINLGLIEKKHDESDQRLVRLSLNKKGISLVKKIFQKQKQYFSKLINKLDQKEKLMLLDILKKLLVN